MQTRDLGASPFKFNSPLKSEVNHKTAAQKVWAAITSRLQPATRRGPVGPGLPVPMRVPHSQAVAHPKLYVLTSATPGKPRHGSHKAAQAHDVDLVRSGHLQAKLRALVPFGRQQGFTGALHGQAAQLLAHAQDISGRSPGGPGHLLAKAELMIRAMDASLAIDRLLAFLNRPDKAHDGKSRPMGQSLHQIHLGHAIEDVKKQRDQFMQAAASHGQSPQEVLGAMRQALKELALANLALLDAMEPGTPCTVEQWEEPAMLRAVCVDAAGEDVPAEHREAEQTWIVEHVSLGPAVRFVNQRGDNVTRLV